MTAFRKIALVPALSTDTLPELIEAIESEPIPGFENYEWHSEEDYDPEFDLPYLRPGYEDVPFIFYPGEMED